MKTNLLYKLEALMADEEKVEKTMNAAAAVISRIGDNDRPEVLLIQRAADDHWPLHWEFPRGKCDKPIGENLIHCLKREVKEETGLDVKPIEKIDIIEYLADGGKRKTKCHNYLCMLKDLDQKIKLSKEHDNYKWITEMGEVELMVMADQKKTLEKVFHSDRTIATYPHDNSNVQTVEEYLEYLNEVPVPAVVPMAASGGGIMKALANPSVMKVYFAAMIAKMAYDFYKKNFSKFARECKGLPELEKNICMLNAKSRAKAAEVAKLKSGISGCSKAKNPEKCKTTLTNKLNQASSTMKLTQQRMAQLKKGK